MCFHLANAITGNSFTLVEANGIQFPGGRAEQVAASPWQGDRVAVALGLMELCREFCLRLANGWVVLLIVAPAPVTP